MFLTNYLKIFIHKYPSDIDRSQFAIIAPILESSCKTTAPRTLAGVREKSIAQKIYLKNFQKKLVQEAGILDNRKEKLLYDHRCSKRKKC